ncbi:MAG: FAD-dependent oxidoreductase, partial [Myxococcota bacterium]
EQAATQTPVCLSGMDQIQLSSYVFTMTDQVFDVAIIGAGPTGASLAIGLAQAGLEVAVIDARDPTATPPKDGRNFAIVTGSWQMLESLGVAAKLGETSQPLNGLEATDGGTHYFGQPSVLFTKDDLEGVNPDEPLGHMTMAEPLQAALDATMSLEAGIHWLAPERFDGVDVQAGRAEIHLASGKKVHARLLVGADGMNSPVRHAAQISTEGRDYGKSVFTANVVLEAPHQGIARQLFTPEGPFATLPLTGDRANLAWYMKRGAAETLAAMPTKDAEVELNQRFAEFAGRMTIEGKAGSYPLILQLATAITAPRVALIGDAARRVNPLAGQGLNQGFRDVAALIEIAQETLRLGGEIGSPQMLETYSAARNFDGAGTALALSIERRIRAGQSARSIDRHLLIRGLLIAALDIVLISWFWIPGSIILQVLYAIGISLWLMIPLRRLATPWLLAVAVLLLLGGEALTGLAFWLFGRDIHPVAALLVTGALYDGWVVVYPLLPWLAMMMLGWAFGRYLLDWLAPDRPSPGAGTARDPVRLLTWVGVAALVVFVAVRAGNGYGNMMLLREDHSWVQWLHISKYPPSITFTTLELGLMAVILAGLIGLERRLRRPASAVNPVLVFGQTALFFYLLHIPMLELGAHALGVHQALGIGATVVASAVTMAILYPLCRWYRGYKSRHPGSWARYI